MMITQPLLYPVITEVNSKGVLTSDGVRLSLTALLFHIILKIWVFYKISSA